MYPKVKIIIADDNKEFCNFLAKYLRKYNNIEILGIANTDEEEIDMIENLKPEIVITDLLRNNRYTGLDIIKKYYGTKNSPEFLVISADREQDVITDEIKVAGYIKKPFIDYNITYESLIKIRNQLIDKEYLEWNDRYHNNEIIELNKYFIDKEFKTMEKLGIKIKNKIYTECEFEVVYIQLLKYYEDGDMDEEELMKVKNLENTGVSRKDYNDLMKKFGDIIQHREWEL